MAQTGVTRAKLRKFINELDAKKSNTRFERLVTICAAVFGRPVKSRGRGSHLKFRTPWRGDPRITLQRAKGGKAKAYQVEQVIAALRRMEEAEK